MASFKESAESFIKTYDVTVTAGKESMEASNEKD